MQMFTIYHKKNSKIKDVKIGMGVKIMSDLLFKEIYCICETKNRTEEQVKEYKMTEREYYRRFDNLSKKELHKKMIKKFMSEMMLWQLLLNVAGVKKQEV